MNVHSRESAEKAIKAILRQYKIDVAHPAQCLEEAEQRENEPGLNDPALEQWQSLPFVTIDNPDSKDLDQALLIEPANESGYRVRYALADAAYYAPPGSALFAEALRRGVTYYTPLLAAPMLPRSLSEGLVSLNPHKERRALVFDMTLSNEALILCVECRRAVIVSQAKLSYESVQVFLDSDAGEQTHEYTSQAWADSLRLLKELGEKLIQRAHDREVIPFNRREADISIDEHGIVLGRRERVRTEKYNEQISLLCNMQGAQLLTGLLQDNEQLQAIFRAHDAPLANRLKSLRALLHAFAQLHELDDTWLWKKEQSLADYVAGLPKDAESRGKVLAIERQILVCNQASEYRPDPHRHHALAASSYARFSSPMREVVGIFTHKELLEALGVQASAYEPAQTDLPDDNTLREQIIEIANQSRQTQKQISKSVEFVALQSVLGQDLQLALAPLRPGIILGFKRDRIYVSIDELAIDLKVFKDDIERQHLADYEISELAAKPVSQDAQQSPAWQLGDRVLVQTVGFDAEKNRFQLALHHH